MDTALLEQIGMTLGVGGLIAFMFFIILILVGARVLVNLEP